MSRHRSYRSYVCHLSFSTCAQRGQGAWFKSTIETWKWLSPSPSMQMESRHNSAMFQTRGHATAQSCCMGSCCWGQTCACKSYPVSRIWIMALRLASWLLMCSCFHPRATPFCPDFLCTCLLLHIHVLLKNFLVDSRVWLLLVYLLVLTGGVKEHWHVMGWIEVRCLERWHVCGCVSAQLVLFAPSCARVVSLQYNIVYPQGD